MTVAEAGTSTIASRISPLGMFSGIGVDPAVPSITAAAPADVS